MEVEKLRGWEGGEKWMLKRFEEIEG